MIPESNDAPYTDVLVTVFSGRAAFSASRSRRYRVAILPLMARSTKANSSSLISLSSSMGSGMVSYMRSRPVYTGFLIMVSTVWRVQLFSGSGYLLFSRFAARRVPYPCVDTKSKIARTMGLVTSSMTRSYGNLACMIFQTMRESYHHLTVFLIQQTMEKADGRKGGETG